MRVYGEAVPTTTSGPGGSTNAYLVAPPGLLVDPAAETSGLTDLVHAHGVDHVAVTHTHPDHTGGLAHYAEATGATVWAHERHADRFETATSITPDRTFRDGSELGRVTVLETPGHAPDHVVFAADEHAITGDLVFREGSVFIGDTDGNMAAYLETLKRVRNHQYTRLYPGHGPVIEDPDGAITRLIEHRLDREARILRAVREGARTVDAIVAAAYDQDLTGKRELARSAVRAHLTKLAAEQKVRWDGQTATPFLPT